MLGMGARCGQCQSLASSTNRHSSETSGALGSHRDCLLPAGLHGSSVTVTFLGGNHGGGLQLAGTLPGILGAVRGYRSVWDQRWEFDSPCG